jgi:hypothetical protein
VRVLAEGGGGRVDGGGVLGRNTVFETAGALLWRDSDFGALLGSSLVGAAFAVTTDAIGSAFATLAFSGEPLSANSGLADSGAARSALGGRTVWEVSLFAMSSVWSGSLFASGTETGR